MPSHDPLDQHETLVVGCGKRPVPDAINLDMFPLPGVDVIHNLNKFPYPFENQVFMKIIAEDVIEHVDDPIAVVQELGRILKIDGTLWIRGPDGRYPEIVWADLTHKRAFAPRSFDGFDPEKYDGRHYGYFHGAIKFKVESVVEKNKGLEFTLRRR